MELAVSVTTSVILIDPDAEEGVRVAGSGREFRKSVDTVQRKRL